MGKIARGIEAFSRAQGHCLFYFRSEEDRDIMLHKGPWLITSQVLAIESWISEFILDKNTIIIALIWM